MIHHHCDNIDQLTTIDKTHAASEEAQLDDILHSYNGKHTIRLSKQSMPPHIV